MRIAAVNFHCYFWSNFQPTLHKGWTSIMRRSELCSDNSVSIQKKFSYAWNFTRKVANDFVRFLITDFNSKWIKAVVLFKIAVKQLTFLWSPYLSILMKSTNSCSKLKYICEKNSHNSKKVNLIWKPDNYIKILLVVAAYFQCFETNFFYF